MKELLEKPYKESVDYSREVECFNAVIAKSVDSLVEMLVFRCEQVLAVASFSSPGDALAADELVNNIAAKKGDEVAVYSDRVEDAVVADEEPETRKVDPEQRFVDVALKVGFNSRVHWSHSAH
jgi:hypothetical protein